MSRAMLLIAGLCLGFAAQAADPTMPPWYRASAPVNAPQAPLRLEGVIERDRGALAIINGTPLAVGESIRGFKLVSISGERVRLRSKQGSRELSLARSIIHQSKVNSTKPSH